MEVELRMQYCGEIFQESFETYELVVQEEVEKIKLTIIIENKYYSVIGVCNLSMFKTIFFRFPEIVIKRPHLKNLKISANKFIKNKKIQHNDKKK